MIKAFQSMIGDGEGNVSSSRVILLLFALSIVTVKVVNAIRSGGDIAWNDNDLWIVGIIVGGGTAKTLAESTAKPVTVITTPTTG
jgi:hypothetical protein